jgi:tRNA-2-methylthio-N6-dimethylallyladenosine synthase
MQRTYSRDEYLGKIAMIREAKRPISITTDIIVGFPGETEREFEETLNLLEAVKYESVFSFKYSPRPNTPAESMADAIPDEEKSRRLAVLMELQRKIQTEANEKLIGQRFEVHVEGKSRRENQWSGHTSCYRVANLSSAHPDLLGRYVTVAVKSATPNCLIGVHVD